MGNQVNGVVSSLQDFQGWGSQQEQEDLFSVIDAAEGNTANNNTQQTQTNPFGMQNPNNQVQQNNVNQEQQQQKPQEPAEDLFGEGGQGDEGNQPDDKQKRQSSKVDYISMVTNLKNAGLLNYELEEGTKLDSALAEEIYQEEMDNIIYERAKSVIDNLPQDVKELNEFVLNGGSLRQYVEYMNRNRVLDYSNPNLDLNSEEVQEDIVRTMLKKENPYLDEDDISTQIEMLKDAGKLHQVAQKKIEAMKMIQEQQKRELFEQQQEYIRQEKEQVRQAKNEIYTMISNNQEIAGVRFSRNDKNDIPSYMHDKTIQLQNGTYITEFQKDLFYEVISNPKSALQLAVLLRHRNKDNTLNFEPILKKAQTNVVNEIKDNVNRKKYTMSNKPQQIVYRRIGEDL